MTVLEFLRGSALHEGLAHPQQDRRVAMGTWLKDVRVGLRGYPRSACTHPAEGESAVRRPDGGGGGDESVLGCVSLSYSIAAAAPSFPSVLQVVCLYSRTHTFTFQETPLEQIENNF